jgi:hypothetical protein
MDQTTGNQKKKLSKAQKKKKALKLFIQGESLNNTAKQIGVNIHTVSNWAKAEDWHSLKLEAAGDIRAGVKDQAVKEGIDYVLNISRLQKICQDEIAKTKAGSKEGLIREIRELEKLKITKRLLGQQDGGAVLITGDDILLAIRSTNAAQQQRKPNGKVTSSPGG